MTSERFSPAATRSKHTSRVSSLPSRARRASPRVLSSGPCLGIEVGEFGPSVST